MSCSHFSFYLTLFSIPTLNTPVHTPYDIHTCINDCGYVQNGYNSDYTVNINNIGGTFVFIVDTEFDTGTSVNTNREIEGTTSDLSVIAAALESILQKQ